MLPRIQRILRSKDTGITVSAAILFAVFAIGSNGFMTEYNLFNVSRTVGFFVLIALSQAVVLVVGGMNLSVGAIGGMATITIGICLANRGMPGYAAVAIALAVGALAGLANGLLVTRLKINSFITTLATQFIFFGLVYGISGGIPYSNIPQGFTIVGRGAFLRLPTLFWIMLAVLVLIHYMFRYTVLGRRLLATGGNLEAARLSGINTDRMIVSANTISGVLASLAAILWVSRMGSAQPATGKDWLINSFAVAIVGGTGLAGGSISAIGILMGAIIIVLITNGLVIMQANVYYEPAFLGSIILLAVIVERIRQVYVRN